MVNYVLSFCKITGASKIFKRNFYLPLLKPQTPKDAFRTLRITGKWLLGAKIQHYIPVLLHHTQKRPNNAEDYGKRKHEKLDDYTYMAPNLDPENDNHKLLLEILKKKSGSGSIVYTVNDKKYNIVFDGSFEQAIRSREIVDVLVSQRSDKIIVKLKNRKKIPIEIQYYEGDDENLITGEGATTEEEEKQHHHGKYTMSLVKTFEEIELREEKWEEELKKIMKRRKKQKWENSRAYKEMMKRNMKNLDWDKFEAEAKKVIEEISEPLEENPIEMEVDDLETTRGVNETILNKGKDLLNQLPTLTEIPDVIKSMGSASLHQIETENNDQCKISGVKVTLPSGKECFVSGQMVLTEDGEVFVPGQTVNNEYGDEYVPGITTNIDDRPTLVGGLIMGESEKEPMFLPSHSAITSDGQLTFASTPEERPPPLLESERKLERKKRKPEEEPTVEIFIIDEGEDVESDSDEMSSSIELNSSEIEELDIEAISLRQEQHRLEMEKLKQQLHDDMDDVISNLEKKKAALNRKLEELRQQHMHDHVSLVTYVNEKDTLEVAARVTQHEEDIIRLSDIFLAMTRRASTFLDKNSVRPQNIRLARAGVATDAEAQLDASSDKLKILFKTALVAANDVFKTRPKDQLLALAAIADILVEPLKNDPKLLTEFKDLMKTQLDRNEVCNAAFKQLCQVFEDTKIALLASLPNHQDSMEVIEKILGQDDIMQISFAKIVKTNPDTLKILREQLHTENTNVKTEEEAVKTLRDTIVATIKITMDQNLEKATNSSSFPELIETAISFGKALGLEEVVEDLTINSGHFVLEPTADLLRRTTIIKQLASRDYSLKTAIARIKKNPECAKSDPRIRQIVRESAVLISNQSPLLNSRRIPLQLMKSQNLLAIEDFLVKRGHVEYPVLISRNAYQAVIPKDASRGVLAGRVPYVLIDESGVTNFKPMHMMSAIQVNKNREKRIDDYLGVSRRSSDIAADNATYLKAKSNGSDMKRRPMSPPPLFRGYGPRA